MKKIISAIDGLRYSDATVNYSLDVASHINAHLVGVFLDDITYHNYKFSDVIAESGGVSDLIIQELNNKDEELRDQAVEKFKEACQNAKVKYAIHRDRNIAIQELLHESIYADLLIIGYKERFNNYDKDVPPTFLADLLTDVQCPVLLVPEAYSVIEKLVLLYDGTPSSVYAAKMFSYLLPTYKSERVEILTVNTPKENLFVPDKRLIKEFARIHYPHADYLVLKGDAEFEINNYIKQQKEHVLVVLGAYRRNRVSMWFKHSMADTIMKNLQVPLFIAHQK